MAYQPLDEKLNEIRVLTLLSSSSVVDRGSSSPPPLPDDLVRCQMENVSLDAYSREYQQFLSSATQQGWLDKFSDLVDTRDENLVWAVREKLGATRPSSLVTANEPPSFSCRYLWGDFEALSYSWGDSCASRTVVINGNRIEVSANLEAGLRELRDVPETRIGMRFWIDALCIDQSNVSERNSQVKLMKDIYTKARAVVVWLGAETETDHKAVNLMCQIYQHELERIEDMWVPWNQELSHRFGRDDWEALHSFLQRRYWQRLWIIQELALNHNSTLILCGKWKLCRKLIEHTVAICLENSETIAQIVLPSSSGSSAQPQFDIWTVAFRVSRLIGLTAKTDINNALDLLLDLTRRSQTSDSRDKVYGLLGIIDPSISSLVNPDYSLSVLAVYKNFAKCLIIATSGLDILFGWAGPVLQESWPSWIPDWRQPYNRNHLKDLRRRKASGGSLAKTKFSEGDNCLICTGFKVDTIDGTSSAYPTASGAYNESLVQPNGNKNHYGNDLQDAFWQTLCLGRESNLKFKYGTVKASLANVPWSVRTASDAGHDGWNFIYETSFYAKFHQFRQANKHMLVCGQPLRSFFDQPNMSCDEPEKAARTLQFIVLSLVGRRVIITGDGYLGLAPEYAKPGDVIAILNGCNFPIVLRQHENRYRVIGECYLHGFMDGKIVEMTKAGECLPAEFQIV